MARQRRVLIIKLGYSETLLSRVRRVCSLGDVLRTTVLLHLFEGDDVTWLTDSAAIPLLEGNERIVRLLVFDPLTVLELENERFDAVINLEKVPAVCAMADRIEAWAHYGFRFDKTSGRVEAYEEAYEALAVATRDDVKKLHDRPWAAVLYDMLGARWNGESYVPGYRPRSRIAADVGFNSHVGTLMPVKAWPRAHWRRLETLIGDRWTVSRQRHLHNLYGYMDWIHSCRVVVTCDSLGLFLGIALDRKVVALLGPTSVSEQSPHPNLRILTPEVNRGCMPCCSAECALGDSCMQYLAPDRVVETLRDWALADAATPTGPGER